MSRSTLPWLVLGLLLLGGGGRLRAQDDAPPPLPEIPTRDDGTETLKVGDAMPLALPESAAHEAFRAPRQPPASIIERPTATSPDPKAVWIKGYWEWDDVRKDFAWAVGGWRLPPPGKVWMDGTWKRDEKGWYRVPGSWTDPPGIAIDWRRDGPPSDHPADDAGPAPGPEMFHVAGVYVPEGERLVWRPGFWSRLQPGWDWIPARWVRQADGWSFREGAWRADDSATKGPVATSPGEAVGRGDDPSRIVGYRVARPASGVNANPSPDRNDPEPLPQPNSTDSADATNSPGLKTRSPENSPVAATGVAPANPLVRIPTYVWVLPDGRRITTVSPIPPQAPARAGPGSPARRGSPLLRPLGPQRRRGR